MKVHTTKMETLWYKRKIFTSNEIDIIRMNSFTINMKKKNEIWYIKNRKLENNDFKKKNNKSLFATNGENKI